MSWPGGCSTPGPEGVRFGAIVTVTPFGGRDAGMAFADKLRLAALATSLGGTHTLVSHVASTTHRQLDDRALAAAGIDPARCGSPSAWRTPRTSSPTPTWPLDVAGPEVAGGGPAGRPR